MAIQDGTQTWPANIGGVPYEISLARNENGKLTVRANGRAVTRPFSPDDSECIFSLAGATCTLSKERSGSYDLVVQQPLPDVEPGEGSRIGVTFLTPRLLVWSFIGLLFLLPVFWLLRRSSYENVAQRRVEQILAGMSAPMDSTTIGLWARDTRNLADNNELSWASDKFDLWRNQKGIFETLKSWKVIGVEEVKGAEIPTAIVNVEIDGKTLAMKVPERQPISWAQ